MHFLRRPATIIIFFKGSKWKKESLPSGWPAACGWEGWASIPCEAPLLLSKPRWCPRGVTPPTSGSGLDSISHSIYFIFAPMSSSSDHSLKACLWALLGPSPLGPSSPSRPSLQSLLGFPSQGTTPRLAAAHPLPPHQIGCWFDTGNDLYEKLRISPLQRDSPWFPP